MTAVAETKPEQQLIVVKEPVESVKAKKQADSVYDMADAFVVDSQPMYEAAGAELQACRDKYKQIEAQRVFLKEPFLEGGRRIDAFFKAPLDRLQGAAELLKGRMLTYQTAEEEKARKAREQAEAEARAERVRLENERRAAEAEQKRLADEQRAADAEAARKIEEARKAGDAEAERAARIEADAKRAEIETAQENAAEVANNAADAIEIAEIAPAQLPTYALPKASGISTRQTWKHEVTDLHALIIGAAEGLKKNDPTLASYVMQNDKSLGQAAKSLQNNARIPGVRMFPDRGITARSAK